MFSLDTNYINFTENIGQTYDSEILSLNKSIGMSEDTLSTLMEFYSNNGTYEFILNRIIPSKLDSNVTIHKYKQYYKGIEVYNGGITFMKSTGQGQGPGGTDLDCDLVMSILPNIYFDIDILNIPVYSKDSILANYGNDIAGLKLIIVGSDSCDYSLNYSFFSNIDRKEYLIDANSGGVVLEEAKKGRRIPGPTIDYGQVDIGITNISSGETILDDGIVVTYDVDDEEYYDDAWTAFIPENVPKTTLNEWPNDKRHVYQAHYVTRESSKLMRDFLDIDFTRISVASASQHVGAVTRDPIDEIFNQDGSWNWVGLGVVVYGKRYGEYISFIDVAAHELTHSYLNNFLDIKWRLYTSESNEHQGIQEGMGDIVGHYIESKYQEGSYDWILYDDNPSVSAAFPWDLSNPEFLVGDFDDFNDNNIHEYGRPFSYFFSLLVNGNQGLGIPSVNDDDVLRILLESFAIVGTSHPRYEDIRDATLLLIDEYYGVCSDMSIAFRRAWEAIGMQVDIPDHDGCDYVLNNLYSYDQSICEEDGSIVICAEGNDLNILNSNQFKWTMIGKKSVEYGTSGNQSGNGVQGGKCLTITEIPEFDYYPQILTVKLHISGVGSIRNNFVIRDCDLDDPTCEDYFNDNGLISTPSDNSVLKKKTITLEKSEVESYIIFDSMGNQAATTEEMNLSITLGSLRYGLYFVVEILDNGGIGTTKKIINGKF